jgi:exopolyphosphatase/guanosine-5'-triphosphate,3'-diphosphate pyrophosphatase
MNRLAAIDIGTNTILLLLADIAKDGTVFPLREMERTTRLGRGLAVTGHLHPESVKKSLQVIKDYVKLCNDMGVERVLVAGTSALRQAENEDEFLDSVHSYCGLAVQILSGEEEARLAYQAVEREMGQGSPLLVIDIGGGSVEFVVGKRKRVSELCSLDIGAVRLTESFLRSDPIAETEFQEMIDHIMHSLKALTFTPPRRVFGLGGTITTISAVRKGKNPSDPSRLHGSSLFLRDVSEQVLLYKTMTRRQRLEIPGLPQDRADIILAGTAVLLGAMKTLRFDRLTVSCHGLRYGLIYAATSEEHIEKGRESC